MALAALDPDSDIDAVSMQSGAEELKSRFEVLLGARPEALVDESQKRQAGADAALESQRERVAAAGGELLSAALAFLGELVGGGATPAADPAVAGALRSRLENSIEEDAAGRPQLRVTLPSRAALAGLAETLARLLVADRPSST